MCLAKSSYAGQYSGLALGVTSHRSITLTTEHIKPRFHGNITQFARFRFMLMSNFRAELSGV
jgi:hypothetical protein